MDLQDAFFILGIIVMSLILLILIAVAAAVFIIKSKISHLHKEISTKLNTATTIKDTVQTVIKKKRR